MNEDTGASRGEHKIGNTWKGTQVETIAEASAVQVAPNLQLRQRVTTANATHVLTASRSIEPVHDEQCTAFRSLDADAATSWAV